MAFELRLTILEGAGAGETYLLTAPRILVGRAESMEISGPDRLLLRTPTVSREHAILEWDGRKEKYRLVHRSRTNQTVVNGKAIKKAHLEPGDRIQVGTIVLQLELAEAAPPGLLPPPEPPSTAEPPLQRAPSVAWARRDIVDKPPPMRRISLTAEPEAPPATQAPPPVGKPAGEEHTS